MPVGDLDGWRQTFTEDFSVDVALGAFPETCPKWGAYPDPWKDSSGHGTYSPHLTVSIQDGILTKHIHYVDGRPRVAALLPKVSGLYGRYAVRWRADKLPGYKVAWLLWPNSTTSPNRRGEIDWPEMSLDSGTLGGYVHRTGGAAQGWCNVPIDTNLWHTDIIEWSPNLIVLIHDGNEIYRTSGSIPTVGMHWVLQTETALGGAPAPSPEVDGNVQIDWVAAWAYDVTAKGPEVPNKVTLTAPATAVGTVMLGIEASADVSAVKWNLGAVEIGYDGARPFARSWDSTRHSNGTHVLYPKGRGASGWFDGPKRTIAIRNPWALVAPTVATGVISLGVTQYPWYLMVKWVVDGHEVGSTTAAPWLRPWDSRSVANGPHTVYVKVQGGFGWADGPDTTIEVAN
jgi:hypothetical protein